MMEVGNVTMAVRDRGVCMAVEMSPARCAVVVVMAVAAGVFVFVVDRVMDVNMLMAAAEHEGDAGGGDK